MFGALTFEALLFLTQVRPRAADHGALVFFELPEFGEGGLCPQLSDIARIDSRNKWRHDEGGRLCAKTAAEKIPRGVGIAGVTGNKGFAGESAFGPEAEELCFDEILYTGGQGVEFFVAENIAVLRRR